MSLDEQALRLPTFRGGVPVRLADGQDWIIPRPSALWVCDDSEDGATLAFDIGPEYDTLVKAVEESTTAGEAAKATFKAAKHLLRLNYVLEPDSLAKILRADFRQPAEGVDETEAQRIGRELTEVCLGATPSPKPSPVGVVSA